MREYDDGFIKMPKHEALLDNKREDLKIQLSVENE
jgi:hypothetical protein